MAPLSSWKSRPMLFCVVVSHFNSGLPVEASVMPEVVEEFVPLMSYAPLPVLKMYVE